ncbi:MAG TPA: metallophosphoesterase [Kineosporiaceae bacterium]|nr:metallophosphoesterase [Kineosporiaceae bacterium]
MGLNLVIVSDTHLPLRARTLPDQLWAALEAADVVVHAGDWVSEAALDEFEARCRRLVAVYGNNDGPHLRARLPEIARVELAGLRIAVVHETGPAKNREARCAAAFPDTDLLIFGHSHIPWDSTAPGGLRLINPGSPTDRRRQPFCTYLTATLAGTPTGTVDDTAGTGLRDVVLHRLPPRPSSRSEGRR